MTPYIIVFMISIGLFALSDRVIFTQRKPVVFVAVITLCLLAGLRAESIGTDTRVYLVPIFEAAKKCHSLGEYLNSSFHAFTWTTDYVKDMEPLFPLLVLIVTKITGSLYCVQTILELCVILPLYIAVRKDKQTNLWMAMFVFCMAFYNPSMNMMRQSIAMSLGVLGFEYWRNEEKKNAFICVFIAFLFHTSSLLIDVNTTSVRTLPEDKWIIAENAHAAIVTRDEYYQAQKAIRNVTPIQYKVGDEFALKGKICCGNCNRQLRHERQYGEMVFYCGYKRSAGKFSKCYGGYYREYSVNAKVVRAIKTVFYALDVVNQGMQEKQSITVRCVDIEDLEKQAEAIRVEQIKLYESYADGVLLRDAYIEKKKVLSEKLAVLQDSIRTEKEEQECADELDEEIRALTKQASEKTYIGGLTKECVDAFVSMVYLYDDQTMKIEFNCEDVIRRALEKYGA